MVFHLPLRQTEGFLRSLAQLLELDLPIPDHTTLSRRLRKLGEIVASDLTGLNLLPTSPDPHTRSLVENAVFRYKTIIGRSMRSRSFDGQRVEVQLASKILNTMTLLGMPESYEVA
jgi:Transposase DDE domain